MLKREDKLLKFKRVPNLCNLDKLGGDCRRSEAPVGGLRILAQEGLAWHQRLAGRVAGRMVLKAAQ